MCLLSHDEDHMVNVKKCKMKDNMLSRFLLGEDLGDGIDLSVHTVDTLPHM